MRFLITLTTVSLGLILTVASRAQDRQQSTTSVPARGQAGKDAELEAIRKTEATFKAAFNDGDAQAVAAHWSTDGEFVDESGSRLQGREAIAKEYAAFFAANPGIRITSQVDQLRLLDADTAIEEGTAFAEPVPPGAAGATRYTVVHVKQDGQWLMAHVHETRGDPPSRLEDLDHLIGTWVAENQGVEYQVTCRWIANKKFLEQSFESRRGEELISSGKQIVGWDPGNQTIGSWTFTSDGGHASGRWTPHETGWIVETTGAMSDGTPTSAVNILTALDDNGIAWRSVNRTAGEFRVLDTEEVILRRKPADQK